MPAPPGRPVVLIVIKGLGIGGAEKLISEAAGHWDRDRFEYRVAYLLPWKDQLVAELRGQDVDVTMVGGSRGMGLAAARGLRRHISRIGAALVHAHLPSAGILSRLVSPAPVVYTEHNVVDYYRPATRLLNRATYGRNAAVIAVSQAVADSVAGYPGPPVKVIPNGVSCVVSSEEAAAARAELGIGPDRSLVVHVGNIRPHKGHRHLIAASALLHRARPEALVVSIGGEKHPGDLDRLEAETAAIGLGHDALRFLGRREDARSFLAAADVVVNPADVEGLPIALLEAMSLRKPVVATAVGGVPDLIEDGVEGLLVAPADPEALATGVDRLLGQPDLRRRLGEAARTAVASRHGLGPMVREVEKVYEEILGA